METCLLNGEWFANHFLKDSNEVKKSIKYILKKCRKKYKRSISNVKEKNKIYIKKKRFVHLQKDDQEDTLQLIKYTYFCELL